MLKYIRRLMAKNQRLGIVQVDEAVWEHLGEDEKAEIKSVCDAKLKSYFERV